MVICLSELGKFLNPNRHQQTQHAFVRPEALQVKLSISRQASHRVLFLGQTLDDGLNFQQVVICCGRSSTLLLELQACGARNGISKHGCN